MSPFHDEDLPDGPTKTKQAFRNYALKGETSSEADAGPLSRPFHFKKKKPLAGAYPINFSPYRMANNHTSRNPVSLIRSERSGDLRTISESLAEEFKSEYFEEHGTPLQAAESVKIPSCKPLRRTGRHRTLAAIQVQPKQVSRTSALKATSSGIACVALRENVIRNIDLQTVKHRAIAAFAG